MIDIDNGCEGRLTKFTTNMQGIEWLLCEV